MKILSKKIAVGALCCLGMSANANEIDPASGFIIDENWELVRSNCAVCHSAKLVTAQRGSRATWESMIRWMQKTQGLWQIEPVMEGRILDYLARNYPPGASYRRKPLAPDLMPPVQ